MSLFLLALSTRLWFACFDNHQVLFNACDASEYLRYAKEIQLFLERPLPSLAETTNYLTGQLSKDQMAVLQGQFEPLYEIFTRSGPVYPLFLFSCFSICGIAISTSNVIVPVIFQCVITALACPLIAYIGTRLWNKQAGVLAGIMAAFYPGFIVNSSRLLSEPIASTLLCLVLALCIALIGKSNYHPLKAYLLGITIAVLQLTRSALVLVTATLIGAALLLTSNKKVRNTLIFALLGIGTILGSFMTFQYLTTGRGSLMVDRLSNFNLFIGLDLDGKGWLTYPYPNFSVLNGSYFEIISATFKHNPTRFLELILDKIPRLFAFPWNDFRTSIGIFGPNLQVLYHHICLIFSTIGLCLGIGHFDAENKHIKALLIGRILLVVIFLVHFVYVLFESQPRYALTGIPIIIIYAGAGLSFVIEAIKSVKTRKYAIILLGSALTLNLVPGLLTTGQLLQLPFVNHLYAAMACQAFAKLTFTSVAFFAIYKLASAKPLEHNKQKSGQCLTIAMASMMTPFIVIPLNAYGPTNEWIFEFNEQNPSMRQILHLPNKGASPLQQYQLALIIDCKNWSALGQETRILVNGKELNTARLPLMPFIQDLGIANKSPSARIEYDLEGILSSLLIAAGGTNLDIRQWFMVPIPNSYAEEARQTNKGILEIEIENKSTCKSAIFGSYIVKRHQVLLPGVSSYSFGKAFYGIESDQGFSDMRFPQKVHLSQLTDSRNDLSCQPGLQTGTYNVRLLSIPSLASPQSNSYSGVAEKDQQNNLIPIYSFHDKIPSMGIKKAVTLKGLPTYSKESLWTVTVKGLVKATIEQPLHIPIWSTTKFNGTCYGTTKANSYESPWMPSYLTLKPGSNQFQFSFPVMPNTLGEPLDYIEFSVRPGGRANGNQFYSIHRLNPPQITAEKLQAVMEKKIEWQSLEIEISPLYLNTPLSTYEIF